MRLVPGLALLLIAFVSTLVWAQEIPAPLSPLPRAKVVEPKCIPLMTQETKTVLAVEGCNDNGCIRLGVVDRLCIENAPSPSKTDFRSRLSNAPDFKVDFFQENNDILADPVDQGFVHPSGLEPKLRSFSDFSLPGKGDPNDTSLPPSAQPKLTQDPRSRGLSRLDLLDLHFVEARWNYDDSRGDLTVDTDEKDLWKLELRLNDERGVRLIHEREKSVTETYDIRGDYSHMVLRDYLREAAEFDLSRNCTVRIEAGYDYGTHSDQKGEFCGIYGVFRFGGQASQKTASK